MACSVIFTMSDDNKSDSSTSESEVSACSSSFDPYKALYSSKTKIPVKNAPLYDNLATFESAQKKKDVIPVGKTDLVKKREDEKKQKELAKQKELEEINKQRFSQYENQGEFLRLCHCLCFANNLAECNYLAMKLKFN